MDYINIQELRRGTIAYQPFQMKQKGWNKDVWIVGTVFVDGVDDVLEIVK
jgi:hypothetical protein